MYICPEGCETYAGRARCEMAVERELEEVEKVDDIEEAQELCEGIEEDIISFQPVSCGVQSLNKTHLAVAAGSLDVKRPDIAKKTPSKKAGPKAIGCIFRRPVMIARHPEVAPGLKGGLPVIGEEAEEEEEGPILAPNGGTFITLEVDLLVCLTPRPLSRFVVELLLCFLSPFMTPSPVLPPLLLFTCNPPYLSAGSSKDKSSLSR
jgi:hypothetical protein